ncbi:MAG TPA: hypothetical protein VFU76_14610 [Terriglobales bacterium]|nr:hypothetical protein [Terriglobales bacterium]
MTWKRALIGIAAAVLLFACSSKKDESATATQPAAAAQPAQPAEEAYSGPKACDLFPAADAEKLLGGPVQPSAVHNTKPGICMYEATTSKSVGGASLTLTVDPHATSAQEDIAWRQLKEVRHLQADQKNTKSLPGIGDEAWSTGATKNGKVGVGSVVGRVGNTQFMLDSMSLDYVVPAAGLQEEAKKVADKLK